MWPIVLAAFLAAAVALTPFGNVPTQSIQPLQAKSDTGVLRTICTTFSINERAKMWGTAAHCLARVNEGVTEVRDVFIGDRPTTLMMANIVLDVAVLRAEVSAPAIPLSSRPSVGDPVRVYGYMWEEYTPTIFFGRIANLNARHYMLFDMRAGGGHSGSPILNVDGHVVSILQAGWDDGYNGGCLFGYLDELLPYWAN